MNKRMITFLMSGVVLSTSIIPVQLWAATSEGYYAQASKVEVTEDVTEIDEMSVSEDMVYQEAQDVQAIETRTPSYDEIFKVKNIKSYSNNGGKYGSSSLDKAFDGNTATHWETGKPNSSTHTNEVIVTFDEIETINRITYMVRQDNGFKGFPNEFSIYTSLEETGDNFKIVKTGKMNTTKNKVEIQFNPTQVKRLKFVFNKADQNWASAAELNFYKEDVLSKKINDIFTDGLMMTLKPEYNSLEAIARLEQEISNHPLKDELSKVLETAKQAINGEIVTENRLFIPNQYGDTHAKARNQLLMKRFGTDLETTGLLAVPGEEIRVYVEAEDGVPLPVISFTQHEGHYKHWKTDYQLKKGMNVFIVPEIFSDSWAVKTIKGGPIYIQNKFTPEQQGKAPQVRIEGGQAFPVFNSGDDQEGFLQELRDFKVKRDANPNGLPNVFEYNTERIMFTGSFDAAYKVFVQEGQDVQESVNVWQNKVQEAFDFAGIDSSDSVHNGDHVRTPIRLMQPYGAAYAASSHIGVQRGIQENFLRPSQMNSIIFGTMHEVGHQMDIPQREWQEVTNNMWSNNAGIQTGKGDRTNYNELFPLMTGENTKITNYDNLSLSARLGLFWQLELEYPGYWTALERLYREKNPQTPNYQAKVDTLATYSSEVIGANLTEFYDRYAFPISESCRENLKQFPDTGKKYWYMWTNAYRYTGTGFDDKVEIEISSITSTAQGNKLQMTIDKENSDGLMGYEIYRDNTLLGFAKESSFIDQTADPNTNYTYEVVAVDKKLNMTEKVSRNVFAPAVITQPQITLRVNSEFNPLDFVNALTYKGEDISKQVRVISNTVDMTQKGEYEVVYEVVDNDAVMTGKSKVSVVGDYDYVSDINWESAKVDWLTANKDKAPNGSTIQLINSGIDRSYEKGLGVHANSEVIYNIEDMGYTSFEAYIGIDQSLRGNANASATFEVWVDGKKSYESGVFKHNTPQQFIEIPLEGAKEIKLITTDAKNSNSADHTVWADAKLIMTNGQPKLEIPKSISTKVGEPIDYIGDYTAFDTEDGDLTNRVTVSGDVDFNRPGDYTITYTVIDSDGNRVQKTRSVAVVALGDYSYLTDYDWQSAHTSHGTIRKDKSPSDNIIRLTGEKNEEIAYERGLGTHAIATVVYDLSDKDYKYFTAYVGVDRAMYGKIGSVGYEVWADGEKVFDSGKMNSKDPQKYVEIDINGVKELKLITNDGGNGIGSDHGVWADTKLHKVGNQEIDSEAKAELKVLLAEADQIQYTNQEQTRWENFVRVRELAREVCNNLVATDEECNEIKGQLEQAIEELKYIALDTSKLQALVDQVGTLDETIYTVESWEVLSEKLVRAEEVLINEHSEVTQEQINEIARELQEAMDNLEEKVIESEMKSELRQLLAEADRIAYTNQEQTRWNNFVYIRNLAHSILNNPIATDRDYRDAMMHLSASMKELGYKKADKSKLQALLNEVLALDEEVYTVESWAVLMNQVTIGKNVVASVGTSNTQEHVDKIARELQQAIEALEEKNNTPEVEIPQSPYYKQLENLISEAATYNKEEYTYETWRTLERAVQYGEAILAKETATEAEFEIAIDLLWESINGLELLEVTSEVIE